MCLKREGVLEKDLDARYLPTLAVLMIFGIEPLVKIRDLACKMPDD